VVVTRPAPTATPRTAVGITAILDQEPLDDPAAFARARALADTSPPPTTDPRALAAFYAMRGRAAAEIGRGRQEITDLTRAAEISASTGSADFAILISLAFAEIQSGRFSRGVAVTRQAIAAVPRSREAAKVGLYANLAGLYARAGDLAAADHALAEAHRIYDSSRSFSVFMPSYAVAAMEAGLAEARATVLAAQGEYTRAEPLYRHALPLLAREREFARSSWHDYVRGRLAESLVRQGRYLEGEAEARTALIQSLRVRGRNAAPTANALTVLAFAIAQQGRATDVEALARAAIDIHEKAGTAPDSLMLAVARIWLGVSLAMQERWQAALLVYEVVRDTGKSDPEALAMFSAADAVWAMALLQTGQTDRALPLLHAALTRSQSAGDRYVTTAQVRGLLAMAYAAMGDIDRALEEFRHSAPFLLDRSLEIEQEETSRPMQEQLQAHILSGYVGLLATLGPSARIGLDPVAEGFRLAEAARGRSVQRAVDASAVRFAAATPALADLVRREQDAGRQVSALGALLTTALSAPTDAQSAIIVASLRPRIERARSERARLRSDIARAFPRYADLIDPKPVTITDVRRRLSSDEALIATYVTADRAFVWAVPPQGSVAFAAAPVGAGVLAEEVTALRRALDPAARTLADIPEFDVDRAFRIYARLLEPVASGWRDAKRLLVVADGALGQLPFALLPTRPVTLEAESGPRFARYRGVPWLVRSHAVTVQPSATSLVTLRALPPGDPTRRPFIGFGDPWFSPEHLGDRAPEPSVTTRGAGIRLRDLRRDGGQSRTLAALPRLPETADEVRSIAAALGADPQRDVFLGARANEQIVASLDLSKYRVVAFATHGLVPGDLEGLTQPALALTAPEIARVEGTGLLTMDRILGLRLQADWVVLSACNTAAARGAGAEAISGLGRAFFYAGARALLVSNWPVETISARVLTTDLFRRQQREAGLGRAAALQQTMNALIDDGGFVDPATGRIVFTYAHPIFWAPFSLVGDGG
jgi:CHAT domain-containing protein